MVESKLAPSLRTELTRQLSLKGPLIVAPMAGGPSTVDLVVESSAAGALGSIGAAYLDPGSIMTFAEKVRARTSRPFAINLFIQHPLPTVSEHAVKRALAATARYRRELGLREPQALAPFEEDFDAQFESVLKIQPSVLSFIFGPLKPEYVREAKSRGIYLIGTATSEDEVAALDDTEIDAIVLQGIEAGGHRAIFDPKAVDPEIPALELLKQVRGKTRLPLISAGGIMNSADMIRALGLGASAVQMGTAFLAVKESGIPQAYRAKLLEKSHRLTRITRAFSGRLARGIENRFMLEMECEPDAVLPFPVQNKFTRDLRAASAAANSSEFLSMWSGSGDGELSTGTVKELIETLFSSLT